MRKNLKEARRKAGMTQKQVAEYLGVGGENVELATTQTSYSLRVAPVGDFVLSVFGSDTLI